MSGLLRLTAVLTGRSPFESPLIRTSSDGRKYIRSSELIRDPKIRRQIAQARMVTKCQK
jgi:hypothetical protein